MLLRTLVLDAPARALALGEARARPTPPLVETGGLSLTIWVATVGGTVWRTVGGGGGVPKRRLPIRSLPLAEAGAAAQGARSMRQRVAASAAAAAAAAAAGELGQLRTKLCAAARGCCRGAAGKRPGPGGRAAEGAPAGAGGRLTVT